MSAAQWAELEDFLATARAFEDLPGKWQAAIVAAELGGDGAGLGCHAARACLHFDALPGRLPVLCHYALQLTLRPWEMERSDLTPLREAGFSDRDIVDANQVVSYFNYVNRVADGLGVELEPSWPREVRTPRSYDLRRQGGSRS